MPIYWNRRGYRSEDRREKAADGVRDMLVKDRGRKVLILAVVFCVAAALCACGRPVVDRGVFERFVPGAPSGADPAGPSDDAFRLFCDRVFADEMSAASLLDLHYTLCDPQALGIAPQSPSLGSCDLTEMIQSSRDRKLLKEELLEFDRDALSKKWRILYDALLETIDASLAGEGLELYEQPLAPTIGVQAQLPILLSEYAFRTPQDVEDYLSLLSQTDDYYAQIMAFESQKADAGLAPSDATIDRIIESCKSYLVDPENNFLTETFESRLAGLEQAAAQTGSPSPLSEEQKDGLRARHAAAIRDHFIPAYEALISGMESLKGRGIRDGGLCEQAEGKAYYEYLLRNGAGISYTVEELKDALARQMDEDLSALAHLLSENPSCDTAEASFSLSDPQEILDDLKKQEETVFPECPDCGFEIRYVPKYLESSLSPAFYLTAPADDPNRNVIYINNGYSDSKERLYTTLAHEGFPGHLYQTVYSRSHAVHPLSALLSCSGANEGWATYAENYAYSFDNGLPDGVGEYRARTRSFSLCVHGLLDIGVNYEGWSLEQAAQFISRYFQADDETVRELWQTVIDTPANYLEYCGGCVELTDMRREAEEALGDRFSLKEFHRFILDTGPVPFSVMWSCFEDWLAEQAAASGQIRRN